MLQTFFLNMFFGGKLKGMPPKLTSDNGEFVVIRPLAYVAEKDLIRWAAHRAVPHHPVHAVRQPDQPAARADRQHAARLGKAIPGRAETMFTALQNVVPSHLMDHTKHDFKNIQPHRHRRREWRQSLRRGRPAHPHPAQPLRAAGCASREAVKHRPTLTPEERTMPHLFTR